MPLFKRKRKVEGGEERFELPELPPISEMQQIKDIIRPPSEAIGLPKIQPFPFIKKEPDMIAEVKDSRILTQEISEPIVPTSEIKESEIRTNIKMKEPIFVKIDKFKDALANFELIKEKIIEIDNMLKKMKETRAKEQEEFNSWEKELDEIKDKVANIDVKLFSKIE